MKLADDLREVVALLNSANVEYLIVGGHAVGYHDYPRYTGDIDISIRRSPENAARVAYSEVPAQLHGVRMVPSVPARDDLGACP